LKRGGEKMRKLFPKQEGEGGKSAAPYSIVRSLREGRKSGRAFIA